MNKSKKEKTAKNTQIQIEFDSKHLPVIISALETYSRLQSGQISMAMEEVYADRWLTHEERDHIESIIRYYAFPSKVSRTNDGHGGFKDQYDNSYNEKGEIINEGEAWKRFKKRPHLNHKNSSFGVGCEEMKQGTIAWEIKKVIQEYLHYKRNKGYRDMGVDGDGVLNVSSIPTPKVIDPITKTYWRPIKKIKIPKRYQEKIKQLVANQQYKEAWSLIDNSFKKTPLPKGSSYTIEKENEIFYIAVEKPFKSAKLLFER